MKNKIIWLIVGLLVIGGIAWLTPSPTNYQPTPAATTTSSSGSPVTTTPGTGKKAGFSTADVAAHNTPTDCYTMVGDKVYDLTSWINEHPGGAEAIIGLCGTDGTAPFGDQHGSSEKAQKVLESYFVGQLIN